jgi:hypothetical protein
MPEYKTVTQAVKELNAKGYTYNFSARDNCLHCAETDKSLSAKDFEIDEFYRFEGETDPGDESVVYAISSKDGELKGILVNAYGPYADPISDELIEKLKIVRDTI